MRALWIVVVLAGPSCVKTNAFTCEDDSACTGDGARCEPNGSCSVNSTSCESGRQYSDTAGDLANTCVGGGPEPDGPEPDGPEPDGPGPDGPGPDTAPACVGYDAISGGASGHTYKTLATADTWLAQQNLCNADGGYMAIPNDAGELAAIVTKGGSVRIWLGVNDRVTENTIRDTLMQPYNALMIVNNGPNDDCATNDDGQPPLVFLDCDGAQQLDLPAVCECE